MNSDQTEFECQCCYKKKPLAEQHDVLYHTDKPEGGSAPACDTCYNAMSEENCADWSTWEGKPRGVKPGTVWVVITREDDDTEWLFQILAVLVQGGKKFYPAVKVGTEICPLQIVLFDEDGEQMDDGHDPMGFCLVCQYDPDEDGEIWAEVYKQRPMQ
jgi:hypothetical protein